MSSCLLLNPIKNIELMLLIDFVRLLHKSDRAKLLFCNTLSSAIILISKV